MQDGIGGGVGVNWRHVNLGVLWFDHAGQDEAVHAVQQGVGVCVATVQQIVDMVRVVGMVWGEGVRVLVGAGQLAVVAEIV